MQLTAHRCIHQAAVMHVAVVALSHPFLDLSHSLIHRTYCRMLPLSGTATAAGNVSAGTQTPTSAPTPDLEGVSQRGGAGDRLRPQC